jgi:hypothetical protein
MRVKEFLAICCVIIVSYGILYFDFYLPVVILSLLGIVPVYFMFQKVLKKTSQKEYTMDEYTHDIKILGIGVLLSVAVFALLFVQESLSFKGGFCVALMLLMYVFLYIDFLRKKIATYWEYNEVNQSMNKASIALLLFLMYNILYYA